MVNAREAYKLLSPLWRRLRLLISRGVVGRTESSAGLQRLQMSLLKGETRNLEHMEPYGFTARPLKGAETIAAAVGGARGHLVALVASDRRYRRKGLAEGEVALYTDEGDELVFARGRVVRLNAGNAVEVTAPEVRVIASTSVTLDTPLTTATGNLVVEQNINAGGNMVAAGQVQDGVGTMSDMRGTYNSHTHNENDNGGPTDSPNQGMI
ncbi:phage baseplate assembly protein V [Marinobacter subterrani]|uniref:Phage baseplate assembly protein V n=1 Tax=Marinobacter subterrani TaxID=1658765 RepID=A0A0J7J4A6_9GAMM|nr:phage baseplate assembly protein V [Marinobacter subterrani]KMQ72829.1 phage baseplate assembly protein V [Marinobacter subterrani]KMQ73853.1 phage baseplate assembly protein V [Marinobacter subterrani]KMQ75320.1 phage baseplate assembly protein V [Marinobacter subterrani]